MKTNISESEKTKTELFPNKDLVISQINTIKADAENVLSSIKFDLSEFESAIGTQKFQTNDDAQILDLAKQHLDNAVHSIKMAQQMAEKVKEVVI